MKAERGEIKNAAKKLGGEIGKKSGKTVKKLTKESLEKRLIPKNMVGISDQMVEGIYGQAYRLYNAGKYKDAVKVFRTLLVFNPNEPKYTMGMAACFHMMKEYKAAIDTYAICSVHDPNNPIPHFHATDCYVNLNDPASAIISLKLAVKRAGEKPEFKPLKDRAKMMIEKLSKKVKQNK
jgi:type III secretion system low calcium response chaperone LcrH/SycD